MGNRKICRLAVVQLESRIALNSYFVSLTGNDNNGGTTAAPWLTLQHAADHLVAGDSVTVEAGTYAGFSMGWNSSQDGTVSAPIVWNAQPGVVINAKNPNTADGIDLEGSSYVTINGFDVENPSGGTITRAGIRAVWNLTANAHGVIIENNTTNNCGTWGIFTSHEDGVLIQHNIASNAQTQHGIYVSNASVNPVIRGNTSFGNNGAGIHMNGDLCQGGTGLITGALVEDNIIHDNGVGGASGINCDGVQSSIIQNNLLYNNHASGISLYDIDGAAGSIDNVVVNNTIVMPSGSRWALNIKNGSTGNTAFNNILYNAGTNGSINIAGDSLSRFTSNFNVVVDLFSPDDGTTFQNLAQWQSQTGQDKNSMISTPSALFVSAAGNNYQLSATSPAVDAGVPLLAGHNAPTVDILSTARPQGTTWDIGAYERIVATSGVATHFSVTAPASTTAGSGFSVVVTALTGSNTTATSYTGTVHFTSTDGAAILPVDYTFTSGDGGVHTFSNGFTLKTAGTQTITATDKTTNTIAGAASMTVNPGTASRLQLSGFPSPDTAGVPHSFTVKALDAFGNTATGYAGTVTFTSSDSQARLPSPYTFTSSNSGIQSFSGTLMTPGMQAITTTDTTTPSLNASESGISVVTSTPIVQAGFTGPSSGVRGQSLTFTLGASESGLPVGSMFSFSIDWGDGNSAQTLAGMTGTPVSHVFTSNGAYTVTATAMDATGNSSSPVSASVSITAVALEADPANSSQTALVVGGTIGNNTIVFTPADTKGSIRVSLNGVNQGTFQPTGHIIAYGQSGNDIIKVSSRKINGKVVYVNVPALLFGGDGTDTLDVSGSKAGNLLEGGAGADSLIGGKGQDILIGGLGSDTLQAGSGGDILIGGTTSYDNNAAALAALLAEWSRTDITYLARIAQLVGSSTGGLNGSYLLNSTIVQSDGSTNYLYGSSGLDWYFAGVLDLLFNQTTGETVTPI